MVFRLTNPLQNERKITQSVIQIGDMLGMYQAELARILGQQCGDVAKLATGRECIKKQSTAWANAVLFIDIYQLLFDYFEGDGVAMYHWMRADNIHLQGTPHKMIVDDHKLQCIYDYLQQVAHKN